MQVVLAKALLCFDGRVRNRAKDLTCAPDKYAGRYLARNPVAHNLLATRLCEVAQQSYKAYDGYRVVQQLSFPKQLCMRLLNRANRKSKCDWQDQQLLVIESWRCQFLHRKHGEITRQNPLRVCQIKVSLLQLCCLAQRNLCRR